MYSFIPNVAVFLLLIPGHAYGNDKHVAKILQRLDKLENTVSDQSEIIKFHTSQNAALKQKVWDQDVTMRHQASQITALKHTVDDQANAIKLQSDEINALKEIKAELSTTYDEGKTISKRFVTDIEIPVAFTAAITPTVLPHIKHMDTIKFETIITRIGGGYNEKTGVFVVPVSGIYTFSCSLLDHTGDSGTYHGTMVHAEIVQDHRVLGRIFAHAETRPGLSYRDQGAQTVYTKANQGDQIWVRAIDNDDLGIGGELFSTFSGCLLHTM